MTLKVAFEMFEGAVKKTIPEHKNCVNCGMCCGPTMATKAEIAKIKAFVKHNLSKQEKNNLRRQYRDKLTCPYRDNENKKCSIYKVRPEVCRLFGIAKGMNCPEGNTFDLDGGDFVDFDRKRYPLPNFLAVMHK